MGGGRRLSESGLIARYFAPLAVADGARGLRDDAVSLTAPAGHELVVTTDTLVAGVHFFGTEPAGTLAAKALRVNLSDLTAKGAEPIGYLLSLALQEDWTEAWLAAFTGGLDKDQKLYGWSLLGGDTTKTPGPLTITVTAIGSLPAGEYVSRDTARAGDALFVSGTIGDAALGLRLAAGSGDAASTLGIAGAAAELIARYHLPHPPVAITRALRAHARAAMDISDGLAGDCGKMCAASGVSARIDTSEVPLSEPVRRALGANPALLRTVLTGGDDYQVLAAVPEETAAAFAAAAKAAGVRVTRIGGVEAGDGGVTVQGPDGEPMTLTHTSYSHF